MTEIGDASQAMFNTTDLSLVLSGLVDGKRKKAHALDFTNPVVVYRGKYDIGKHEKKFGEKAGDIVYESIGNIDEYSYDDLARDLKYNDRNESDILKLNPVLGYVTAPITSRYNYESGRLDQEVTGDLSQARRYIDWEAEELWIDMEKLTKYGIAGEMLTPWKDPEMGDSFRAMMKQFRKGTGETLEHWEESDALYRKIRDHHTTQEFVTQNMNLCLRKLFTEDINGDLNKMEFKTEWRGKYENGKKIGIYDEIKMKPCYMLSPEEINKFNIYELYQRTGGNPVYNDIWDKFFGLGITIHAIWAIKVQIENFQVLRTDVGGVVACRGKYVVMIYDNFGLDDKDIEKFPGKQLSPFWAWYMLQRYTKFGGAYKPFINQIRIEYDIAEYTNHIFRSYGYPWKCSEGYVMPK